MTRSTILAFSIAALAVCGLAWVWRGGSSAPPERSLTPEGEAERGELGAEVRTIRESMLEGRRPVHAADPAPPAGSLPAAETILVGFLVDHRGAPLANWSLVLKTVRGSRSLRTDEGGGFRRVVQGEWTPRIASGAAEDDELRVWSRSAPLDPRACQVELLAERTHRLRLVQRPPDYLWNLEFRLPDGRPHASAGVKLRYRTDRGEWAGWHETQGSTDASGRVSFRLWEADDIVDWTLSTNGVAKPGEKANVAGGRPVSITVGGRHHTTGPRGRFEPQDEPEYVVYTLGYARPLKLYLSSLPFENPAQLEFELFEGGMRHFSKRRFGPAGHASFPAMLLPGEYEVRLSYGDRQWSQSIDVEAAVPRVEHVRVRVPGKNRWQRRPTIVVDPQRFDLNFRPLQREGR